MATARDSKTLPAAGRSTLRVAARRERGGDPRSATAPDTPGRTGASTQGSRARGAASPGILQRLNALFNAKFIAGVPARIMRPRLVFIACLGAILAFGLLMVYSASSVEALQEYGSSTYYFVRQAAFIAIGLVGMAIVSSVPLSFMRSRAIWWIWLVTLIILVAVPIVGHASGGATRWISIGGFQFQPSEPAKAVIIVTAAKIFHEYYEERSLTPLTFVLMLVGCVLAPAVAILAEPDFGTCVIILGTVFAMCYFAGFSYRLIISLCVVAALLGAVLVLSTDYRLDRLISDPWSDPYGDGYQAVLAIMAFASGGLFGRGIGNSTMKYNYLPEAHNDYILAVIGEEIGFVGTIIFFAVYVLMVLAAFKIAANAPTIQGRLIAMGSAFLIMLQFVINALGILAVTPMTGKPMPFISYGGSSMISMLALAGLIIRVSRESNVRTVHDARRERLAVIDESTAGEARPRSARRAGFSVVEGSPAPGAASPRDQVGAGNQGGASGRGREARPAPRAGRRPSSYERIDLNQDPASRLRTRDGRPYRVGYDETGSVYGSGQTGGPEDG